MRDAGVLLLVERPLDLQRGRRARHRGGAAQHQRAVRDVVLRQEPVVGGGWWVVSVEWWVVGGGWWVVGGGCTVIGVW